MMSEKLIGTKKKGVLFILSAPAGTGKTTLIDMLEKEFPSVVRSVSYTTRPARAGEVSGEHYHFIDENEFRKKIQTNEFLEYVTLYGYLYGTSSIKVEELLSAGKHVVLVIDTQGAMKLKGLVEAVYIFLLPPSMEILRNRLQKRSTETESIIQTRMEWAEKEMQLAENYDYIIVNDDLQIAYQVLRSIFIAEDHRR